MTFRIRKCLRWFLPPISILLFFGCIEVFLYAIDFKSSLNLNGNQIPFWARNAPSALSALDKMARTKKKFTNDAYAYKEDLYLFYKLRPNLEMTVSFYDFSGMKLEATFPSWSIITDEDGHRVASRQRSNAQKGGVGLKKIAFMGGSSFFGWGTDYENTCAYQLELLMKDHFSDEFSQFINYAVPGYAMNQHLRLLKTMINRGEIPDMIVLDATSNCDVRVSITDKERERIRLRPLSLLRFHLGQFRFFQLFEMWISQIRPNNLANDLKLLREPIKDYQAYLEDFIEIVKANKIMLIMVGICSGKDHVDKMISIAGKNRIPHVNFYELVSNYTLDTEDIPFSGDEFEMYHRVFSSNILDKNPSLYLLFPDKCHPNSTGHRVLALYLMQEINRKKLLN
jgi:hypothetical protein